MAFRIKFYIIAVIVSLYTFPALLFWFLNTFPCFPGNFAYFLIPECSTNYLSSKLSASLGTLVKIVFTVFTTVVFQFTSTALVFELVIFSLSQIFCLSSYLRFLCHRIQTSHCIEHMNKLYQEIQILAIEYNNIHQNALTTQLTMFISSCFIIPLYMLIAFWNDIPLMYLIFCIGSVFDTTFLLLDFDGNIKSDVYRVSKYMQQITKRIKCERKDKIFGRVVKSWKIIKINIGTVNFYDKSTVMQILNFNITIVINLLLL